MSLVRAWRRELLGASGVAIVVPGTVCAALAVLALAGGFGRLGSLGQVFSGPRLPAEPNPSTSGQAKPRTAGHGNPASGAAAAIGRSRAATTPTNSAGATRPPLDHPSPGAAPGPGRAPGSGGHGGGAPGTGPAPPRTPTPAPPTSAPPTPAPPTPAPPPTHSPTAVDRVVAAGTSVTSQLPDPVGTVATHTLQSVGSTVDQVLPIPSPGSSNPSGSSAPGVALP